jgi:predicted thioredoxin/glutaredoxin
VPDGEVEARVKLESKEVVKALLLASKLLLNVSRGETDSERSVLSDRRDDVAVRAVMDVTSTPVFLSDGKISVEDVVVTELVERVALAMVKKSDDCDVEISVDKLLENATDDAIEDEAAFELEELSRMGSVDL